MKSERPILNWESVDIDKLSNSELWDLADDYLQLIDCLIINIGTPMRMLKIKIDEKHEELK